MRRTLLVILYSGLFMLCNLAEAQTPGLIAAYSFNEGSGTTVTDASGNGNTGTLVGATWTTAGKYSNALSFNGSTAYVDLGNPASLQLTGSATWSAWINATANPADDGQIIAKSDNVSGWQFKTSPDTGLHTFGVAVSGNSSSRTQRYSLISRALNTWYHVAGVYNATAGTLDIYVNGVLNNGTILGTLPASQFNSTVNANIGRRTGGFYFNGIIDEVRVYNRALTQSEIQTDMNTPIGIASPALSACDLNSDSNVNVSDVQLGVNMALGVAPCTANVYAPGVCNVVVVQRVVSASLGGACVTGTGLPTLNSLSCTPTTLSSGSSTTCTLTLSAVPASNTAVALASNNAVLTVPISVTVPSGSTSTTFTATAGTVSSNGSGIVTATLDGLSSTATITLNAPAPTPTLSSLACTPSMLTSGNSSTCTVTLTAVASSNTTVSVADDNASLVVPTSVTVLSGQSTAIFTATAGTIAAGGSATVTATLAAVSRTATITLSATPVPHSVTLSWSASTSSNVTGYNIYRGTTSGGPYTKITSSPVAALTYTDNTVLGGTTYYYVGTAVNSSNLESVYSTQTQAVVPSP